MTQTKLLNVIPECYVDTNLIEYLLNAGVNHQHSCTKVVGVLKTNFSDKFAIGIIDKDKVKLGYIEDCNEIATSQHLTLMKHKEKHQYLITIRPAIDGFILDCAKEQRVDTKTFGIPSTLKDFTKESKSITSNNDPRFKSLFKAIKDNKEIINLKNTLKYLCDNKFKSDLQTVKDIFEKDCV